MGGPRHPRADRTELKADSGKDKEFPYPPEASVAMKMKLRPIAAAHNLPDYKKAIFWPSPHPR